ncbi:MAG: hypothetical protein WDO12_11680 [Pseudomonadota bacterium]
MNKTRIHAGLGVVLIAITGAAQAASAPTLDRAGLVKLADDYFAALVAHDPSRVPFAPDAKFVENVTRTKVGDGLVWKTASSVPTTFKLVIPDPVSQEVGGIVVLGNGKGPTQLGFRLKVANGRIVEAEHLVQGPREGQELSPNLVTVRPPMLLEVPFEYADSRGRLIHIAKSYYDALDNNNGYLAPFAADCERRENGMRTAPNGGPSLVGGVPGGGPPPAAGAPPRPTPPPKLLGLQSCTTQINSGAFQYITTIEDRRVEIADTATGLAMGFSHFHHAMTQKKFRIYGDPSRDEVDMSTQKPFDMPALHVYKIWGGEIHEIEAIGVLNVPFNAPTGWE